MSITKWVNGALVLVVLGVTSAGARLLAQTQNAVADSQRRETVNAARTDDMPVHRVVPGRLRPTVVERGVVEACWNAGIHCRVEGGATISWIVPDGTMVLAGQPVCQLDSSHLQEQLAEQLIIEKQAETALRIAQHSRFLAVTAQREYTVRNGQRDQDTLKKLRADVENKQAQESAKRAAWQRARGKNTKLQAQIENCLIFAGVGGVLVYANDPSRLDVQPVIEVGVTVRERQPLFNIVDTTGPVEVKAHVHEPVINGVERGFKARIKVDAFPGELLTGTVSEVAPLPDPVCFFIGFVKTYTTRIQIDQGPAGVRPGMTAEVEILVNDLENVLSVPVEAVVYYDDKQQVAVQMPDGGFEWCEVTLGQSNERFIEVTQGISDGDVVAIKPKGLLSEAQNRALKKTDEPAHRGVE
jgi:RND family efflux transporter MFP subunit